MPVVVFHRLFIGSMARVPRALRSSWCAITATMADTLAEEGWAGEVVIGVTAGLDMLVPIALIMPVRSTVRITEPLRGTVTVMALRAMVTEVTGAGAAG